MIERFFLSLILVGLVLIGGLPGSAVAALNETDDAGDVGADAISCQILNSAGAVVGQAEALNIGDAAYWMRYNSGGAVASKVTFAVAPRFAASPLRKQSMLFKLTPPSSTSIVTPLSIPFWASNLTSGNWKLRVKNDLGQVADCFFTVVP